MEIEKKFDDGKVIYHIIGRIDTQTAPDLQAALDQGLEEGENNLILDFVDVQYLSSAGLRTILYVLKRINTIDGGKMVLINVKPVVMEVFDMTGFSDFLEINPE